MASSLLPYGPKFVAGHIEGGQFVLTRDDGTTFIVSNIGNIYLTQGTLVDLGDGTFGIELPE
jgi:hypothetical protein